MSYRLLMNNKVIKNGDIVSVYHKNNNIDLTRVITSEEDSIKIKISNIDIKSQAFHIYIEELGIDTTMGISKDSKLSIIETDKISDPNILFKLKGKK